MRIEPSSEATSTAFIHAVRRVQHLVSGGAPAQAAYQTVVDNAVRLLNADSGSLRVRDLEDPGWMVAVASSGVAGRGERWRQRAPITEGVSGRVLTMGQPVRAAGDVPALTHTRLAPPGTRAAVGVPIRERGEVIASLVVSSKRADFTNRDEQLLLD